MNPWDSKCKSDGEEGDRLIFQLLTGHHHTAQDQAPPRLSTGAFQQQLPKSALSILKFCQYFNCRKFPFQFHLLGHIFAPANARVSC